MDKTTTRREFLKNAGILVAGGALTGGILTACAAATEPPQYTRSLLPGFDNTFDLGSTSLRWANLFVGNINASGSTIVGAITLTSATYTGNATPSLTIAVAICNSATDFTLTLTAATGSNRTIQIKNIGAGKVTVDGAGADTLDGETTQILSQNEAISIIDYASGKWAIY